ncbi:MAG: hypothetical protein AAF616_02910 [Bacteroidota bacterium]
MDKKTRSILKVVSIVLAIAMILMETGIIPNWITPHFWVMVIAYFMFVLSSR